MKNLFIYIATLTLLASCVQFKEQSMWNSGFDRPQPEHINGFYGLDILREGISSEVWFTENKNCITVINSEEHVFAGKKSVHLKWDKKGDGCTWIGLGIGWDGWTGKDLSAIIDQAAIELKVRRAEGQLKSLPLAAALEDYGGKQAWLGFSGEYFTQDSNSDWSTVTLPLNQFSWQEFNADYTNVKQLIIQFEASGEMFLDEVRVVKHTPKPRQHYNMLRVSGHADIKLDGMASEDQWKQAWNAKVKGSMIRLFMDNEYIYISGEIEDENPLQNSKSNEEIWNGDAIEVAFSSNEEANSRRGSFLYSDQHFGIRMNNQPVVWDWRRECRIELAEVVTVKTSNGYSFEAKIPLNYFDAPSMRADALYGLELAIDQGNQSGRSAQLRWNSSAKEGFHKNPSMWGQMTIVNEKNLK